MDFSVAVSTETNDMTGYQNECELDSALPVPPVQNLSKKKNDLKTLNP